MVWYYVQMQRQQNVAGHFKIYFELQDRCNYQSPFCITTPLCAEVQVLRTRRQLWVTLVICFLHNQNKIILSSPYDNFIYHYFHHCNYHSHGLSHCHCQCQCHCHHCHYRYYRHHGHVIIVVVITVIVVIVVIIIIVVIMIIIIIVIIVLI